MSRFIPRFAIVSNCSKIQNFNFKGLCGWDHLSRVGPGLADRARPGPRDSNLAGRLPGLAREILRIFSLILRAVSTPPRGFVAVTCSLACAQRILWAAARCSRSAYEAGSAMPLYRPSDAVGSRVGYVVP